MKTQATIALSITLRLVIIVLVLVFFHSGILQRGRVPYQIRWMYSILINKLNSNQQIKVDNFHVIMISYNNKNRTWSSSIGLPPTLALLSAQELLAQHQTQEKSLSSLSSTLLMSGLFISPSTDNTGKANR